MQTLVTVDRGHQYSDDPIERLLDRYGIEGAAINAAKLDEATV
jgi:peptide methionine sulfoxide reductase MsrB